MPGPGETVRAFFILCAARFLTDENSIHERVETASGVKTPEALELFGTASRQGRDAKGAEASCPDVRSLRYGFPARPGRKRREGRGLLKTEDEEGTACRAPTEDEECAAGTQKARMPRPPENRR
jgi:hypothetical protein